MNSLGDRLREAYLAAAELVREDAVPTQAPARAAGSKRRPASASGARFRPVRGGRRIAPVAAAAAVAAIALTVGVVVPHALSGPRTVAASGLPEFAVLSSGTGLRVVQTATGHVTGQVRAPGGLALTQVAGDASDRTFYVSAQPLNVRAPAERISTDSP